MEFEDTREKMETFFNYYFLCVNSFEEDSYSDIQPINVSILVFKNWVLSVIYFNFYFLFYIMNINYTCFFL